MFIQHGGPDCACIVCYPGCVSVSSQQDPVVHWSRWRSLLVLIVATLLTAACADLTTEHIKPIIFYSSISQVQLPPFIYVCRGITHCSNPPAYTVAFTHVKGHVLQV